MSLHVGEMMISIMSSVVCMCEYVCMRVCMCVYACVCVCVHTHRRL